MGGRDDSDDDDNDRRVRRKKQKSKRDEDDNLRRRSKKEAKKEHKKRKMHHDSSSDDDEDGQERRSTAAEDRRKKKHRKKRFSSESSSDETEDESRRRRKKDKKRKHKREKKKRKGLDLKGDPDPLERNYMFAEALYGLLDDHPALSADLPIMLIRMAGGSGFDLSQMSDAGAANGLEKVFQNLQSYGVEKAGSSWTWKSPAAGQGKHHELLLIKIARALLDQIGLTMKEVDDYGKPRESSCVQMAEDDNEEGDSKIMSADITPLQKQTYSLLDRFLHKDSTLANQLGELCSMILNGESVALAGLPDQSLKEGLEQLFRSAGLRLSPIEDDTDDDDDVNSGDGDENEEETLGYGLPETSDKFARANMENILLSCKARAATQKDAPRRVMRGPLPEHMAAAYLSRTEEVDSEDEGPAPVGVANGRRAAESKESVEAMAERRRQELEGLITDKPAKTKPGEREEWMINPGEHDLLQGIKAGTMKTRAFENKKVHSSANDIIAAPVDPTMQAEVDAIIQAHKDARGPSLMEQHRENIAAEKAAKAKDSGKSFKWSRDKDLDDGRRVDKEALRLLMGGASSELMDKFQGGFTKA